MELLHNQVEILRNQVSGWSYCTIGSVGGAIVQWVELSGRDIAQLG